MKISIQKKSIYYTMEDKIFSVVNYILLTIILILVLYPLIYILSSSFSSTRAVVAGEVFLWPVEFSWI